jgi:LmbE family N-acetylglucosaminyl deacetylase
VFLPDGRHFLLLSSTIDASRRTIDLGSLDGSATAPLLHTVARAEYLSPGTSATRAPMRDRVNLPPPGMLDPQVRVGRPSDHQGRLMLRRSAALLFIIVLSPLTLASTGASQPARPQRPKALLAVFAHPDDEIIVAPLLAAYAKRGVRVHLVIVTDGEKGVAAHAGIPAGERLAKVRAEEARCSCAALGIEAPTLLGFKDGELGQMRLLADVRLRVAAALEQVRPDAVITFGPEGGYGHTDHRLVGAVVTELVQEGAAGAPAILLYPGFSKDRLAKVPPSGIPWAPTEGRFLTVRVPFDAGDVKAARTALACHKSQFAQTQIDPLVGVMSTVFDGQVYLRPWFGASAVNDVFAVRIP